MAILATTFTTEIILLVTGLFLIDGGLIRKFGAMAIFVSDIALVYTSQNYVSDLTSPPTNVSLFLTTEIQTALVSMLAILTLVTLGWSFITLRNIIFLSNASPDESDFARKKRMDSFYEELI